MRSPFDGMASPFNLGPFGAGATVEDIEQEIIIVAGVDPIPNSIVPPLSDEAKWSTNSAATLSESIATINHAGTLSLSSIDVAENSNHYVVFNAWKGIGASFNVNGVASNGYFTASPNFTVVEGANSHLLTAYFGYVNFNLRNVSPETNIVITDFAIIPA